MNECGCRKGAITPGCDRHDPQQRVADRRPWWWLLDAPVLIAKGLWTFLRHGSGPAS